MHVTIRYFGAAAEARGRREETLALPEGTTVGQLRALLGEAAHPSYAVAVNLEVVDDGAEVPDGAEVAILPPVSGGGERVAVRLVREPVSVDKLLLQVRDPGCGAVALFLGTVRDRTGEKRVVRLEYEAYESMAEKAMADLCAAAATRWPGARVAAVHRLGTLSVGETAVAVAAAAPHRAEAFAACRFVVEGLKRTVPIWKKEIGPDGLGEWVAGEILGRPSDEQEEGVQTRYPGGMDG